MENNNLNIVFPIAMTFLAFFFIVIAVILFIYFSRRKFIARELEIKNLKLKTQNAVIKAMIETQENERSRIARDLHDSFGSKLSTIKNYLENLKGINANSETKPLYDIAIDTCNNLYDNARRISHNMTPVEIEVIGLHNTIHELCKGFENNSSSTEVFLKSKLVQSRINSLDEDTQIHLYRILQELLVNSQKHSEATKIFLEFDENRNNQLIFNYNDNGKGSSRSLSDIQSGLGMQNILIRCRMIGATYELNTAESKGFEFNLILPSNGKQS
jgi:signal transduction histidine kinase